MKKTIFNVVNELFKENKIEELLKIFIENKENKKLYLWLFNKSEYDENGKYLNTKNLSKEQKFELKIKVNKIFPVIKSKLKYKEYFILNDLDSALKNYEFFKNYTLYEFRNYIELINFYIDIWGEENIESIIKGNSSLQKIMEDLKEKDYFRGNLYK